MVPSPVAGFHAYESRPFVITLYERRMLLAILPSVHHQNFSEKKVGYDGSWHMN